MMSKKMNKNKLLTDTKYLEQATYHNVGYLINLSYHIYNFTKHCPVPIFISLDEKTWDRYYVNINNEDTEVFFIYDDIHHYDYITGIRNRIKKFYPQYICDVEIERDYTEEEIIKIRNDCIENKKDFDLEKMLEQKVVEKYEEKGMLIKIILVKDSFIIERNGEKYLHTTVTPNRALRLNDFLRHLEVMRFQKASGEDTRKYIFENSECIQCFDSLKKVHVSYPDPMLINFFKINYLDLQDKPLIKVEEFVYEWGQFIIHFESEDIKNKCLLVYNDKLNNIGNNEKDELSDSR